MRIVIGILLICVVAFAIILTVVEIPFGISETRVGTYYIDNGVEQTGAVNIVTSVVLNYRGFDTLGEVTVLFIAALGLGAVVYTFERKKGENTKTPASLVLNTGCRFLFPLILLFGTYIFIHGHLTPGGGFQGGAIIASAFVLVYLGCKGRNSENKNFVLFESLGGLIFVVVGLLGFIFGGYFLSNFMPKGIPGELFSAGIIPVLYIAIGFKVGSELAGIIAELL